MTEQIYKQLTPFKNITHILKHDQSVGDIMQGILATHDRYKLDYDKIAANFEGGSVKDICCRLWKFLKNNVKYVIEPENRQYLKSPAAIIATGKTTGSDCKNYSLFIGGVLDALKRKGHKINWTYRFSSYKVNDAIPQHVFVVVNPGGDEIWCDAVLHAFNYKKQYYYKIDKKPMALIALSGIGRREKKSHPKRKKFFKKLEQNIKRAGKFVMKFAGAPSRNSFLAIVGINLFGLAGKMKKAILKNEGKVRDWWENLGGNYTKLKNTVIKGGKHKRIGNYDNVIGDPVTGSAAASASPILVSVAAFLAKLGIKSDDIKKLAGNFIKAAAEKKLKDINKEASGKETTTGDQIEEQHGGEVPETGGEEPLAEETTKTTAADGDEDQPEGDEQDEPADTDEGVGAFKRLKVVKPIYNINKLARAARARKILELAIRMKNKEPYKYNSLNNYIQDARRQLNMMHKQSITNRMGDII